MNQAFPALTESAYRRNFAGTPISRSQSHSANIRDSALKTNKRAKVAFLKICDSLSSGLCAERDEDPNLDIKSRIMVKSHHHIIALPTMSKVDFLQKLDEGIADSTEHNVHNHSGNSIMKRTLSDNVLTKNTVVDGYLAKSDAWIDQLSPTTVFISGIAMLLLIGIANNGSELESGDHF